MISLANRPLGKAENKSRRPITAWIAVGASAWLGGPLACNTALGIEEAALCVDCDDDRLGASAPGQAPLEAAEVDASDAGPEILDAGPRGDAASCLEPAPEVERDCAVCGGRSGCDGTCSVELPPGLGEPCGSCGGAIDCSGNCSVSTPSDYGSALLRDIPDSFGCCFIAEVRSYGPDGRDRPGCYPGYVYAGCTISKLSGLGTVSVVSEDAAACTCQVAVANQGLDGASYEVHLRLTRACNGPAAAASDVATPE